MGNGRLCSSRRSFKRAVGEIMISRDNASRRENKTRNLDDCGERFVRNTLYVKWRWRHTSGSYARYLVAHFTKGAAFFNELCNKKSRFFFFFSKWSETKLPVSVKLENLPTPIFDETGILASELLFECTGKGMLYRRNRLILFVALTKNLFLHIQAI